MNVLIIGGGGREHAFAWKCAQSQEVNKVYVAPGNAGTAMEPGVENVSISIEDHDALIAFAQENDIGLTIIGPEAPLVAGIVDHFTEAGMPCFGPQSNAAQLEGSKSFTKDFLKRHNIPTAEYECFTDEESAIAYIKQQDFPVVIKADGLAAGKGVIIAADEKQAIAAVEDMLSGNKFGEAGHRVVIEEFLPGEEASFIVISDGENILPLASSQDHKARDDGDRGPNTGGMGAYSPAPIVDQSLHDRIMKDVIQPTISGMRNEAIPYTGFLYAGIMVTDNGIPKVLEFNCRFGDPETQPILLRLKSDLVRLCLTALNSDLKSFSLEWDERAALGVVLAAEGYPATPRTGEEINLPADQISDDVKIFHAGTALIGDKLVTSGGRVMCVTALGENVTGAQEKVYKTIRNINWNGMFYRSDIGYRAVEREKS